MNGELPQPGRSSLASLPGIVFGLIFFAGLLHWYWLAYEMGSWWMFLMTLFPPTTVVAVLTGAWSFVFGVPGWVVGTFG